MTQKVSSLELALPIQLSATKGKAEIKGHIDMPEVFFGLDPKKQVSLLDGVLKYVVGTIRQNYKVSGVSASSFLLDINCVMGISINYINSSHGVLDLRVSIPSIFDSLDPNEITSVIECITLVINASAVSIVSREMRYDIEQ